MSLLMELHAIKSTDQLVERINDCFQARAAFTFLTTTPYWITSMKKTPRLDLQDIDGIIRLNIELQLEEKE